MKRIVLPLFLLGLLITLPGLPFAATKTPYIAVSAIAEHPALDKVRDGVLDELAAQGYIQGKNLKFKYQSAQGSSAIAAQIAKHFVATKPDVIVAIGTPSAQALAASTKTIPIVFTAVTDPFAAKLINNSKKNTTNITGISDALPVAGQIGLMQQIKPKLKRVGYIYSPGEINSLATLKKLQAALALQHIELIAVPAQRTADIATAARSLQNKVDLIYTPTDNNVVSAYEALAKVANERKIPLIAADPIVVARGASAAFGLSYYDIGRQAGKMILRIVNNENVGDIPVQFGGVSRLAISQSNAEKQGFAFSADLLRLAEEVID